MEMEEPANMLDNEPNYIFPIEKNSISFSRGPTLISNMVVSSYLTATSYIVFALEHRV